MNTPGLQSTRRLKATLPSLGLVLFVLASACGTLEGDPADTTGDAETGGFEEAAADLAPEACDEEDLGADELTVFTTVHRVVDGELGPICLGDQSAGLLDAWDDLATISPPRQISDLSLFAAFESSESGEETTLAFVTPVDEEGQAFLMAINLETSNENADEALLTLAHELTHVFTAVPAQLDRSIEAAENCPTYDNGEGCYLEDSVMFQWIDEFWDDGLIDQIDPEAEATAEIGEDRCDLDAGFLGPYAASSPEEDFAESFSAAVFAVEPATTEQAERIDWILAQPGLAAFAERASDAGLAPLPNSFELCGTDA